MRIISTSALIPTKFESRKIEYEKAFKKIKEIFFEDTIVILECFSNGVSFFENFDCEVFLTHTHNENIRNKGVLEIMGLKKYFDSVPVSEGLIVKVTGRYQFIDDNFKRQILNNQGFDFYGKLTDNSTQVFTGCFAMKELLLREFLTSQDLIEMESKSINIEKVLFDFISNRNNFFVDKIHMDSPIFGNGDVDHQIV